MLLATEIAEERKLVTILFADVTGSTALGERLDPERLRSVLEAYFSSVSAVIASWGGTVEKFIGDAVMAAFGVPVVREDDAERALRAALELLERLDTLNADFERLHGVTLKIRIGVNTGDVIAPTGPISDQHIITGDAVNVAARLEQAAEPGTVLIGERTYQATRDAFRFGPPQSLALKGKAAAVEARPLLGPVSEVDSAVRHLRAPLVGRDRELRAILDHLDEVLETESPRLVVISGPAGIGKSRLVAELVRAAAARDERMRVLRGRCLAAGHGITFWALGEILRTSAGIGLNDPADVARERLRHAVEALLTPLGLPDDEQEKTIHALATTAGLTLPDSPLDELTPEATAAELARAWPRFVTALASAAPVLIVIEDLHWAGDQLVEMVDRLLARSSGAVLLIATARPEFAETHRGFVAGRDAFSAISLRPLTEGQSSELVDRLLDAAVLPRSLRAQILEKAEGNPFFVEELLSRLIDEEALVHAAGRWRATGTAEEVVLPDSVTAVLAARIDALPRDEKRVLQEAAVIGRIFWEEPLAASGNGSVSSALLALEGKGLVFTRPSSSMAGQVEYMFKHALVRDVAYGTLPKARRARAHAEVAAWIERLAGERIDEFIELVAHHYHASVAGEDSDLAWMSDPAERERLRLKAFQSLLASGASARERYAVVKAVELHQQALQLAAGTDERRRALEELGDDHLSVFHADDALAAFRQARALYEPADREGRARLADKIGRTASRWGAFRSNPDPAEMERIIEEGLAQSDDEERRANLLIHRAYASFFWGWTGSPDPMPVEQRVAFAEKGLALAERLDRPELVARAASALSTLHWDHGDYRLAREFGIRQLELADRIASREMRALMLSEASAELLAAGETEHACEVARAGYLLAQDTADHQLMHCSAPFLRATRFAGLWEEALSVLEVHLRAFAHESDVTCGEVQTGPVLGALLLADVGEPARARATADLVAQTSNLFIMANLARYHAAIGEHDEAARYLRAAADLSRQRRRGQRSPDMILWRLEVLVGLGDWSTVRELLPDARRLVDAQSALGPTADHAEGMLLMHEGRADESAALLARAVEGFERLKAPFEAAHARESLGRVAPPDEARAALEAALETYERLGARPHAERVRAAVSELLAQAADSR